MEYIYTHLFEEITAEKLSEVAGLTPIYLSQLFKKETEEVADNSNDTISTIGARLTFYDQAHFIKVFRKHTGVTPKQYRNRMRST